MLKKEKKVMGWREKVNLPELKINAIKVKVDTGAKTASLHAYDLKFYKVGRKEYVEFKVHPIQRDTKKVVRCKARVIDFRNIRSSNGAVTRRPVILTPMEIMGETLLLEVTLSNRDEMGFRMLLGRESIKGKFLVDVEKSFLLSKR